MDNSKVHEFAWRETYLTWLLLAASVVGLVIVYYDGLELMVEWWETREEYSHGFLIPFISLFLIWQKKDVLETIEYTGSWLGFVIAVIGLAIFFVAELGGVYIIIQYSFLLALYGVILAFIGTRAFKVIAVPLFILIFMLPLPNFLYNDLSAHLQLISSQIGVAVIRLFGISVYLEGNIIDLGVYQLQVVEACSGLRYLFPLMAIGFIAAYFFTGAMWKRVFIFLSTIPITVLMNSFRIGVIGVTVEHWGIAMAEGFLHDFEGWVVFMGCTGILILEMFILARIGKNKLPLSEAFGIDLPEPTPESAEIRYRKIPNQFRIAMFMIAVSVTASFIIVERAEVIPERKLFAEFPLSIDNWDGRPGTLDTPIIDKLKLTDYLIVDYSDESGEVINFYSAYYESQRKESTTHSPRACLPGGGWRIVSHDTHHVDGVDINGKPLVVNRFVIKKDDVKQLVYYWFQQRGRIVTNESMVKWYFFVDSVKRQRTDGALVRLVTPVPVTDTITNADKRLTEFAGHISSFITEYVPD